MFEYLVCNPGFAFGADARAMSENELRARDAQLGWAMANARLSCVGLENYRAPRPPLPSLPAGWAEWFAYGDLLH
jgi:hypothetical protein